MSMNTIIVILLCVALLAIVTGATKAWSASVTICKPIQTTIKLPKSGKCRTYSVGGYKVTVCA